MSKNVRTSPRKDRSATDLAKAGRSPASAAKAPARQSRSERDVVKARIERLECYIASADAHARHHNIAYADYVPPAEEMRRSTAVRRAGRRPKHTEELARRRSAALFMQVIMLFVVIAATIGWMNQRFHFWN
jgi:hypothetical protein